MWVPFFLAGWGSGFSAYVVLQILVMVTLKRPLWFAAAVPIPVMLWIASITVEAYGEQSNLWPLFMILASPIAVLYLLALGVIGLGYQAHPQHRGLTIFMFAVIIAACVPYMLAMAG